MHLSSSLSFSPFLRHSRKQNIGASQSEKGSTMHVAQLAIHRRQLASFFPQRTKVRDNRYVGAASRTLTLGDPIFRSLPSLPFDGPLCLCSRRFSLPSRFSFYDSCVRSPARSYPPPPLPLAASLRLLPHLHLLRYFSLSPEWRECRGCEIPEVWARRARTLRYAAASWRATDATEEGGLSASNIVTLEKAWYNIAFKTAFGRFLLLFAEQRANKLLFSSLLTDFRSQLPFSRRCNDTFNCSSLNRGCHEQSEHQKWIELIAGPVAGTSSTWLDLQVSSPTSYFASRKSIWNWQNYYFFFLLLFLDTKSCVARPVE